MKTTEKHVLAAVVCRTLMCLALCLSAQAKGTASELNLFNFAELQSLYNEDVLSRPLENKLNRLLTTPFVDNSKIDSALPAFNRSKKLGEFLRVVHWNIERGLEFEAILAAFKSETDFAAMLNPERFGPETDERSEILAEAAMLRAADVIILNEVDWGMKRTGYRNIAAELATELGMNYTFGVQFVELSPIYLSSRKKTSHAGENELLEMISVDPQQYKGLHGIAILSRFPLENVRLVPFKNQPYDWFKSEKKSPGLIEKGKRGIAGKVFLEKTLREVRRGGRTTLLADVTDVRLPSGRVTIAATHLENRTKPGRRLDQMTELLETVKDFAHPVIIAGDMNTTGSDHSPTSMRREFMKRFGNPKFWIKKGATYALGLGMLDDLIISGITFGRNHSDPTVKHIPFIAPNAERKLFRAISEFRFADGGSFDLRGDEQRSIGAKRKPFSNSNQRGKKGFVTTYQVARPIMFIGKYKLDWIFVKPADLKSPHDRKGSYRFAPHFGRTLTAVNEAIVGRVSDHRPMLVDLPLGEPAIN